MYLDKKQAYRETNKSVFFENYSNTFNLNSIPRLLMLHFILKSYIISIILS